MYDDQEFLKVQSYTDLPMNELPVTRPPQLFSLCAKDYGTARGQTNQSYKILHILDLVLTRCGEDIIRSTVIHDSAISDHFTIRCDLNFKKPCLERKGFSYQNGKAINTDLFKEDIAQSPLTFDPPDDVTQ